MTEESVTHRALRQRQWDSAGVKEGDDHVRETRSLPCAKQRRL
jgi:hypothetical protein